MKIAIGFRVHDGPWGGGNRFAKALSDSLEQSGHVVVTTLRDRDIDFALMMDPRIRHPATTFTVPTILRYRTFKNDRMLVVHRINECDERKGTTGINGLLKRANYVADHTVFVGDWLHKLDLWQGTPGTSWSTIHNGADKSIFNSKRWKPWSGKGPLKLVTHHWGGNWLKGFDIYRLLDNMLAEPEWSGKIDFTYIGNLPSGFTFKHAHHIRPLDGHDLASEIRRHHVYVTASINEPGGNHQNEGASCGLPLLYRNSGCLPEYCDGYGVSFDGPENFVDALRRYLVHRTYHKMANTMAGYPHTSDKTVAAYIKLFEELDGRRTSLLEGRHQQKNLGKAAAALWPF